MKKVFIAVTLALSMVLFFSCNKESLNSQIAMLQEENEAFKQTDQYYYQSGADEFLNTNDYVEQSEDDDFDSIEVIVVNKIPRGAIATEEISEVFREISWYEIGLSRNGKEPIEYIWCASNLDPLDYIILNVKIGDRGIIHLTSYGKCLFEKLPRPNIEQPSVIGLFRDVWWESKK